VWDQLIQNLWHGSEKTLHSSDTQISEQSLGHKRFVLAGKRGQISEQSLGHKRFVLAGKRGLCWRAPPASDLVQAQIVSVLAVVRPPVKTENKQKKLFFRRDPTRPSPSQVAHFFA
jgi:hypothetical protein